MVVVDYFLSISIFCCAVVAELDCCIFCGPIVCMHSIHMNSNFGQCFCRKLHIFSAVEDLDLFQCRPLVGVDFGGSESEFRARPVP